jgi:hypothetical protein
VRVGLRRVATELAVWLVLPDLQRVVTSDALDALRAWAVRRYFRS